MDERTSKDSSVPAKVGVVSSDPLRSIGLLAILEDCSEFQSAALDLEEAVRNEAYAVILLDTRAGGHELIEMIAQLRRDRKSLKVVVMGGPLQPEGIQSVVGAGAKGYLTETASEGEICMAISTVLDGSIWAPRKVLARIIDAGSTPARPDSIESVMTPRELDVLRLLMDGRTNRDIAREMGIDEVTVKAHLSRMLRKTNSSNRVELTLRAMEEKGGRPSRTRS